MWFQEKKSENKNIIWRASFTVAVAIFAGSHSDVARSVTVADREAPSPRETNTVTGADAPGFATAKPFCKRALQPAPSTDTERR